MSNDVSLVSISTIVTKARSAGNLENNYSVSDDQLKERARDAIHELYDMLIEAEPTMWMEALTGQTLNSSRELILPTNFYKLLGLDYFYGGVTWRPLDEVPLIRRNEYLWSAGFPAGFQLRGRRGLPDGTNQAYLQVLSEQYAPLSTYRLLYIPKPLIPINDADAIDAFNGYDKFIVADVTQWALTRIERHEQAVRYIDEANRTRAELLQRASKRNRGGPGHVAIRPRGVYPFPVLPRN